MRKAIIAAIVASALFAVGAFAATFTVDSEDIASGADPVEACATDVDITFDDDPAEAIGGEFSLASATATFLNDDASPANACEPFQATLSIDIDNVLTDDTSGSDGVADEVVTVEDVDITIDSETGAVTAIFNLTDFTTDVLASQVVGAAVLVDGNFLG